MSAIWISLASVGIALLAVFAARARSRAAARVADRRGDGADGAYPSSENDRDGHGGDSASDGGGSGDGGGGGD